MLAPRRRCLDYSKVYCNITGRQLLTWNQDKHYIFNISYTNSEISVGLPGADSFDDDTDFIA